MSSAPFNPLAGDFSSVGWIAPTDDYRLKIAEVTARSFGEAPDAKTILNFSLRIVDGEFAGRKPADYAVWEPTKDFSNAAKLIVSALGYNPGKQDAEFVANHGSMDLTIDDSDPEHIKLGSGYAELVGKTFTATLDKTTSKKNGQVYQNYKSIRPLE